MSPPAAWKRRLRCGLVGEAHAQRRRAESRAGRAVSASYSQLLAADAGIAARCRRCDVVLWMNCRRLVDDCARVAVHSIELASVLHDASSQGRLKRLKLSKQPSSDCGAAGVLHRIDLPAQIAGKALSVIVAVAALSTGAR